MKVLLCLKDSGQEVFAKNVLVFIHSGYLNLENENYQRCFRISGREYDSGNYWIDAGSKSLTIELFKGGISDSVFSVYLGTDFEILFPKATPNWNSYYFSLHYSR